jgi:hypothetical protein
MSHQIRFDVPDDVWTDMLTYVNKKRRWKKVGDFARYATFKEMDANKAGNHHGSGARPAPLDSQPKNADT